MTSSRQPRVARVANATRPDQQPASRDLESTNAGPHEANASREFYAARLW